MGPLSVWGPLWLLLGTFVSINCELHKLTYIYTALSKPVENRGIHDFTAMGLLDTKMIDYFDSDLQEKVPKQEWMKEKLSADYWKKGTESRKSKQQWFKVNLDILKDRMNQTDQDVHVLQWMHGCEANLEPDGQLSFQRGLDMYSYDGNSFLYFDDDHDVWVAAAKEAEQTKRKWDEVQVLKDYTKGYLEKECLDWLSKFMDYGKQQLKHASPPDVYMFATTTRHKSQVLLTCMATGFYPPDIVLNIKRDGRILTYDDGVMTTGIRPNQDDTYQRRDSLYILRGDKGLYTCEVIHTATNVSVKIPWDGVFPEHDDGLGGDVPIGAVVGGIIGLIVVGGIVALVAVMKMRRKACFADSQYAAVNSVSGHVAMQPCIPCVTNNGSSCLATNGSSCLATNGSSCLATNGSSSGSGSTGSTGSTGSDSPPGGSNQSIDEKDPEKTSNTDSKDSAIVADAPAEVSPLLTDGAEAGDANGAAANE